MHSSDLQRRVETRTRTLIASAGRRYRLAMQTPEVRFDLKGKAAGMCIFRPGQRPVIRYNRKMMLENGDAFLQQTVPHEVAHLLARSRYGSSIKPHGAEWRGIMQDLGAEAKRCHNFKVTSEASRRMRYFTYHCGCREHHLSTIRHNRSQQGVVYLCRSCGSPLSAKLQTT